MGESGCGKSVAMRAVLQLVDSPGRIVSGQILFQPAAEKRRRHRPARPPGPGDAGDPGRRDRPHPPGADGRVQPGPHGRGPDRRGDPAPLAAVAARRAAPHPPRGAADHGRPVPGRGHLDAGPAPGRLLLAALGRPPPAGDDRHGAVLQAPAPHRRRAHDRDRRHDPGAGAEPHARAPAQVPDGGHLHHARPGGHRPDRPRGGGDVPRPGDGAGPRGRHLPPGEAPLHARPATLHPRPPGDASGPAPDHHRLPPAPVQPPPGLPLPPAMRRTPCPGPATSACRPSVPSASSSRRAASSTTTWRPRRDARRARRARRVRAPCSTSSTCGSSSPSGRASPGGWWPRSAPSTT